MAQREERGFPFSKSPRNVSLLSKAIILYLPLAIWYKPQPLATRTRPEEGGGGAEGDGKVAVTCMKAIENYLLMNLTK